jgi:hypothetical protein
VRILFDGAAALVLAYLVSYAANDIVGRLAMGRVLIDRHARYTTVSFQSRVPPTHPTVSLVLTFVEAFAIVLFTVATLGAAIEPQRTSGLNGVIYWIAFALEIVVIGRAFARGYRVMKTAR